MTIRVADRAASETFYETVLEPLGIEATYSSTSFAEWDDFSLAAADDDDLPSAIETLLRTGPETLIVKRGAAGAVIHTPGGQPRLVSICHSRRSTNSTSEGRSALGRTTLSRRSPTASTTSTTSR